MRITILALVSTAAGALWPIPSGTIYARPMLEELKCSTPYRCEDHSATMTGYAFGKRKGAASIEIRQGHFANHPAGPKYCPNDPARNWAWGTRIQMVDPDHINLRNSHNEVTARAIFKLYDNGDLKCNKGNYWADIFFGRYRFSENPSVRPDEECFCSGSGSPPFCIKGSYFVHNCNNATSFGSYTKTYKAQLRR